MTENTKSHLSRKIIVHCSKLPLLYFFIGILFYTVSYIDDFFPAVAKWKNFFDLSDNLGQIFIGIGLVTFAYDLVVFICLHYEQKLSTKQKVAALIINNFRKSLKIIYLLIAINIVIMVFGPTRFTIILANNIITSIIIGAIGWIIIQIFNTVETFFYQQMSSTTDDEQRRAAVLYNKMHIIRNIATVVIIFLTTAAILMSFSSVRSIGISLLASAGFLTAIIGFAAQKPLAALFSGLQIALSQPIKIGDVAIIENESGIIEEIAFTYVTIKLGDRKRMIVPINYFTEKTFINWSHESESLRSSIHLQIDLNTPIEPLRKYLDTILNESQNWDKKAHKLQVLDINHEYIDLRIQISAANADKLSDLRAEVLEKMWNFIHQMKADSNQK